MEPAVTGACGREMEDSSTSRLPPSREEHHGPPPARATAKATAAHGGLGPCAVMMAHAGFPFQIFLLPADLSPV